MIRSADFILLLLGIVSKFQNLFKDEGLSLQS